MKSENKNFLLNILYQLLSFVIPFITVPYISRKLGVDCVGIYSYTYSIVYMFMLVGMLGINNYGSRTVAAVRDDRSNLSKIFCSIYLLQLIVSLISIIGYILYLLVFCKKYNTIAMIQGIFLLSTLFDINWFFFGIEKFKLTISRNIIIKLLSLVLVFMIVKEPEDLYKYSLIMSLSTLLSQMYLLFFIRKYIDFSFVPLKEVFSHFKDVMILFVPVLAFGVYKVMDKTMIGTLSNVTELGYYENAEKLMNVPAAIIAALGTVMLPRMSFILSKPDEDYNKPISDSMKLAMKLSSIMCLGLVLISKDIVIVLFGESFEKSGVIIRVLSISIFASAWANVIRTQYLIPLKKDRIYVTSTIGAAILNLLFNLVFIRYYGAIGACIGTIIAEFFVAIYQSILTKDKLQYTLFLKFLFLELGKSISIVAVAYVFSIFFSNTNTYITLSTKIIVSALLFLLFNAKYFIYDFLAVKCTKNNEEY